MRKARFIASIGAIALAASLGGCASAGAGGTGPYAGRHDHMRDAKQGAAPSAVQAQVPVRRGSLRPAS